MFEQSERAARSDSVSCVGVVRSLGRAIERGHHLSDIEAFAECAGTNALRLVDVGGRGGLEPKWHPYGRHVAAILIEPAPDSAHQLRRSLGNRHSVIEAGLSNVDGPRSLFVTQNPLCSSLLEPNLDVLRNYGVGRPHFDIVGRLDIDCRRYDSLHQAGMAPPPDAIKIDTQGHEYEVLQGFGGLLADCLGIELETHLYPIYRGQKLLHQIIDLLSTYDFVLRRLEQSPNFGGDLVEAQAYFTKPRRVIATLPALAKLKHALLCEVWSLGKYAL